MEEGARLPGGGGRAPSISRGIGMKRLAVDLLQSEKGVTTIEYAIIASLLAMGIVVSLSNVGNKLAALYQSVANLFP
jgi:pilus assembly protein Flp/PilA